MKRIRHSPEQIIRKLREADTELASGKPIAEVCKGLGVSEATYHRWRNQSSNKRDVSRFLVVFRPRMMTDSLRAGII